MLSQRNFVFTIALFLGAINLSTIYAQESNVKAIAVIQPTTGNKANGIVRFTEVNGGVQIIADINGLKPGEHGFHIHEFGDCSASDASSAGAHFNPTNKKHGCPNDPEHHAGDMGNIVADSNGHAHFDFVSKDIKLQGNNNVIGRSIIVHEGKDDCISQPAGNSGAKIGCGVIGIAK